MDDTDPSASTGAPPPPPGPPPDSRKLVRSSSDKVLGGVAGGLGAYFNIDAVIFRVGFAALALAGGSGLILYVVAWLLLPDDAGCPAPVHSLSKGPTHPAQVPVILAISAVVLIAMLDHPHHGPFFGSAVWPFALLALGAYLWFRKPDAVAATSAPLSPPPPAPTTPADADTAAAPVATEPAPGPAPAPVAVELAGPQPPSLTGSVLSLLLVITGSLILVDASELTEVSPEWTLAVLLLVTGMALAVSAWFGRARGLIPVALVLTAVLGLVAAMEVPLHPSAGERHWVPLSASDLEEDFELGAGEAVLDLTELDFDDLDGANIDVRVGMGELLVLLPHDAVVDVEAHAGLGETTVFGYSDNGMNAEKRFDGLLGRVRVERWGPLGRRFVEPLEEPILDGPEFKLDARVGLGEVEVRRVAA